MGIIVDWVGCRGVKSDKRIVVLNWLNGVDVSVTHNHDERLSLFLEKKKNQ